MHRPILLMICLECAYGADRVTELIEAMRQMTSAGDQVAVGLLVPQLTRELTSPHPKAGLAWNQLGVYHVTQGNFAEAERAYKRGLQLQGQSLEKSEGLALLHLNLAQLYLKTGARPRQAEILVRRALATATELYGPNAPELVNFVYILGAVRQQLGDREEARIHFDRALALANETTREGKIRRGIVLSNLAILLVENRLWSRARDAMLEAVSLLEQNLGSNHPDLVPFYFNLATLHLHFQQLDLASASLGRARVIVETRLSLSHPYMSDIMESQSFILKKLGRRAEAKALSRRAKAITESQPRDRTGDSWIHLSDLKK